ncbi:MAG: tRNA uridine-5-carboxymethylaminomethyl(34) synthesis GTPase MnmE [Buchnera aphidicola (Periphyllus lyropictus)]|uniref:tRNA uridine-5-carboxymethylaminomethyl(34) synthesis GTPase MnmE n=1 Tax=Buchnera aphidicola TaxID=9 RepID=UPI001ECB6F5B|nr:tRNA uridine-5-carboxymethylaminomethyl(34) synthesis GTPase MnmE [Buchnera aphidicola]NIH16789.1 tRNA uridine-5-carboxymethylaminomethyl(34) synthesis GTPase MnmE [Buchnera aphidicola (Periphyllus lyropictus)]USS94685.1 tRNA uridine-5-carboxymethylaminomethyl(34) synthesis GTPase MnmE [Buchnera aphidicola (Periphyllus lyropictus)]
MFDTIISQITPPGIGGVYIIRISGKKSYLVSKCVLGKLLKPRYATYLKFLDVNKEILDQGIAIWYPSPKSFTGEDVLELQGHGNNFIANLLLKRILKIPNIRLANPGEFSKRAFLNKKIDLIQAEAISDLINANSEASVKASLKSLNGDFSKNIFKIVSKIKKFRVFLEAKLNFSEEDIEINIRKNVLKKIIKIISYLKDILFISNNGILLKEGIKVVIAGFPNSGKSSLFNLLSKKKSSIVTNIKGTTRDLIKNNIYFNKNLIKLVDTAGFRETKDKIEKIGINLAKKEINKANILFFLIDINKNKKEQLNDFFNFIKNISSKIHILLILNKIDLTNLNSKITQFNKIDSIYLSIKKKIGLNIFYKYFKNTLKKFNNFSNESVFISRQRHIEEIKLAINEMLLAKSEWKDNENYEILAYFLKNTQNYLNKITGLISSDDILNDIFSNFCIGK